MSSEITSVTIDSACESCGTKFTANAVQWAGRTVFRQRHCQPCVEARHAAEVERVAREAVESHRAWENERAEAWAKLCPRAYATIAEGGITDEARLFSERPTARAIVEHADTAPRSMGLVVRGPTGSGKTRAMWRLMRRFFDSKTARAPLIVAVTSGEFHRQAMDAAGEYRLSDWFGRLAEAGVFFIDDLGKAAWSKTTTGHFFDLIEERHRQCRPVFITTNMSGVTLMETLGVAKDLGDPLLRRIRETTRQIVLQNQ